MHPLRFPKEGLFEVFFRSTPQRQWYTDEVTFLPTGISKIYGYPYSIFFSQEVNKIEKFHNMNRYKVYPPINVIDEKEGISLFSFKSWPDFKWSNSLPSDLQTDPPYGPTFIPPSPIDGQPLLPKNMFRIDIIGIDCQKEIDRFYKRFINLIRYKSGQFWITPQSYFGNQPEKYFFFIDQTSESISPIAACALVANISFEPINNYIWESAFEMAINNQSAEEYSIKYLDAINSWSVKDFNTSIILLSASLEMVKNLFFSKLIDSTSKQGIMKFSAPFNSNYILDFYGDKFESLFGLSLKKENFSLWKSLENIINSRDLILNSNNNVVKTGSGLKPLTNEINLDYILASKKIIKWTESLPERLNLENK